jgi:hypothetical protein
MNPMAPVCRATAARGILTASLVVSLSVLVHPVIGARQAATPPAAPAAPRAAAPIDLTGYWVSVVTEDWRWRMIMPPKGDYTSVPLNPEGRKLADSWESAQAPSDGCKPFGAAAIMRVPGRLHVTWESDAVLKIETDAGQQTRLLNFDKSGKPAGDRTWQGVSVADWETVGGGRGGGAGRGAAPLLDGSLKVVTTNMRAGYFRRNGVPYSENAVMTEYFDRHAAYGTEWFTVTTIVDDPKYLTQSFITSTHFKKEADGSKWSPTSCE